MKTGGKKEEEGGKAKRIGKEREKKEQERKR